MSKIDDIGTNDMIKIIVALDYADMDSALALVRQLDPGKCHLKVGKELFTRCGPIIIEHLHKLGFEVFLDLKFHDIPNTCAQAVRAAAEMGVWMVNVHASGGRGMMEAARDVLEQVGGRRPHLIAVTALTSLETPDLLEVGFGNTAQQLVERLAGLTRDCGLDGVVCSSQEVQMLRAMLGKDFLLVTPGIRPANAEAGDQKRIMTPAQALEAGSDYLVIGRPITKSESPLDALLSISREIQSIAQ